MRFKRIFRLKAEATREEPRARVVAAYIEAVMSSGTLRPFVSVKFSPVGRTYQFLLPELALDDDGRAAGEEPAGPSAATTSPPVSALTHGDKVIVQTAEGRALGTTTRAIRARHRSLPGAGETLPGSREPPSVLDVGP